jgi:hypothetical protein
MHKKIAILLFVFLSINEVYPQDVVNDILTSPVTRNGVYRTFLEFRTNSPSIVGDIKITSNRIKLYNSNTNKYEDIEEVFWGACLDDVIYFFLKDVETIKSHHIQRLKFLGRYCYFIDERNDYTSIHPILALGSVMPYYKYEYVININNGNSYQLSKKMMRTILEKDEELLKEFEDEPFKNDSFEKYIIKYNERHSDEIKSIVKSK